MIKNMVCHRCVLAVEAVLAQAGLHPQSVVLGEATVEEDLSHEEREELRARLEAIGFELLDSRREVLFERIRNAVIRHVQMGDAEHRPLLSDFLRTECGMDYSALSKLFSELRGETIEKYYMAQRIERAKELLVYDELSVSEIAARLGFSSVAHLSGQFRRLTGSSPSAFKRSHSRALRRGLDEV